MLTKLEIIDRWKNREPLYLDSGERRNFIADAIVRYAAPSDTILELGCNTGSNLVALAERGFTDLMGIDINAAAIDKASERVPRGIFLCGELGEAIGQIRKADIVFSMAVLMHIHNDDAAVFGRFYEIARKYLITCEWERSGNHYIEPRDYGAIFSEQFEQVKVIDNLDIYGITGYTLRVFKAKA